MVEGWARLEARQTGSELFPERNYGKSTIAENHLLLKGFFLRLKSTYCGTAVGVFAVDIRDLRTRASGI
jgi:hypothetical protein